MLATFHLCGDLDVTIATEQFSKGVRIQVYNPLTGEGAEPGVIPSAGQHDALSVVLSKAVARALASAIMGAAAEL